MQIDDVGDRLVARVGNAIAAMTVGEALAQMTHFYVDERVAGVAIDDDGDMLLFQWGCYGPRDRKVWIVDIVRQVIAVGNNDAEPVQVHLRAEIGPPDAVEGVVAGDRWCATPDAVEAFVDELNAEAILQRAVDRYCWTIEVEQV